jgi:hypothetical protein
MLLAIFLICSALCVLGLLGAGLRSPGGTYSSLRSGFTSRDIAACETAGFYVVVAGNGAMPVVSALHAALVRAPDG